MAIRKLAQGSIRFVEGDVKESKSVLSAGAKRHERNERTAFRKDEEKTSIEHYLTRKERKYWNRLRPARKEKVISRALRRAGYGKSSRQIKLVARKIREDSAAGESAFAISAFDSSIEKANDRGSKKAERGKNGNSSGGPYGKVSNPYNRYKRVEDNEASEPNYRGGVTYDLRSDAFQVAGNGMSGVYGSGSSAASDIERTSVVVSKPAEAASTTVTVATGGTSEGVKIGIKAAKKAAESIKRSAGTIDYTRQEEAKAQAGANPSHASGILGTVQNGVAMVGAALTAGFMAIIQPMIIVLLPVIVIAGIIGAILSPLSALEDDELFPDQLHVQVDDEQVQAVLDMANQLLGTPYLMGGNDPSTGIDCSGFTTLCFRAAGVNLPRTAQGQYDVSQHFSDESEALPGDLVFFTRTYNAGRTVTHVEIYLGNGQMVGAGDPVRVTSLHSPYFQSHFYSFGRVLDRTLPEMDEKKDPKAVQG